LRQLVEPATRGDPEMPLLWTAKSLRNLAAGLRALGHRVSHNTVGTLLRALGYSLQANRKTREGTSHSDRDACSGISTSK
jgi:transposase